MTPISERILALLRQLYPTEQAEAAHTRLMTLLEKVNIPPLTPDELFSERDVTLIAAFKRRFPADVRRGD